MKALVTGANGLIGANVVRALLRSGYAVRALARESATTVTLDGLPCEVVLGDLLQEGAVRDAARGCDLIFHTAVPFAYAGQVDIDVERIAIDGSRSVLLAAKATGVPRVIVTSSSIVLGYRNQPESITGTTPISESSGESGYAIAKLRQEGEVLDLGRRLGVDVLLPCPTMSVGPHGTRLSASNGMVVQYLADPLRMTFPGGINIAAVEDVADGHVLIGEFGAPFERYVLGSENLTWTQLHEMVAELAGIPAPQTTLTHTAAYLAATAEEARAKLERRPPLTTREQAKMVGRYYWHEPGREVELGYAPRPARAAVAGAVAWLAASPHVSREVRATMHLHEDVYSARSEQQAREKALRTVTA